MKKFGAYLSLIGLFSQSTLLAWVGGPYGNNTFDGFDGGVFGGTIRGPSTTGIFKFSQGAETYVSPFGDSIVYNKGLAYYGECYGMVDFDSKTVSGVTNGSANGTNLNDPNSSPQYRNLGGFGFGVDNGLAGTVIGNNFVTGPNGSAGAAGTEAGIANSAWNGKITKSKQTMRFKAKGEMSFFGTSTEVTEFNVVNSTGDFNDPRFDGEDPAKPNEGAGTGLSLTGFGAVTPAGTGTTRRTVGATNNFPNIQAKVKIRIYGSRKSVNPFGGPAGYAG